MRSLVLAVSACCVLASPPSLLAQGPPRPHSSAIRVETPIKVDGVLDEPAWALAVPINTFSQNRPNTGDLATERTVVRLVYDGRYLYVGATMDDSQPNGIVARSLKRDYPSGDEDTFGILLATFGDGRSGFMFGVNPRGAIRTGQVSDDGRDINFSWRPAFHWKARMHDQGWTVEMAIPFTALRFDATQDEQVWGMNIVRRLKRKNEDVYWAPLDRRFTLNKVSAAGTLSGIRGIRGGHDLGIKPFVLASHSQEGDGANRTRDARVDAGFDLKYGVTRQVTLDLTYRTDFSQVEVDDEALNITRFSLFLPDKRDFFIENSGVFQFGDAVEPGYRVGINSQDFKLFHSRRIGLVDGRPVPVFGGARLTGRAAGVEFGLLDIQTDGTQESPAENMSVARARSTLFGAVQVGAMATSRHTSRGGPHGDYDISLGSDVNARLFRNLLIQSYFAAAKDGPSSLGAHATRVSLGWRDEFWDASAIYRSIDDDFNPGLGFVRRTGIHQSYATLGGHFTRVNALNLLELNPWLEVNYITNRARALESRTATAGFDVDFEPGDAVDFSISDNYERVFRPFAVLSRATIDPGEYQFALASAQFQTSRKRVLAGRARITTGGFFGGRRTSVEFEGAWKPNHHFSLQLLGQQHRLDVAGERFTTGVVGTRMELGASTHLFGSAFLQYNGVTDEWISNVRLNLIHAPLSDLFVVFTERRPAGTSGGAADRHFVLKVTRLLSW